MSTLGSMISIVSKNRWLIFCFLLLLNSVLVFGAMVVTAHSQTPEEYQLNQRHVLVLNAFESNTPSSARFRQGFTEVMQSSDFGTVNLHYENLGLGHRPNPETRKLSLELVRQRHKDCKIELIVTLQTEGLKFLLDMGPGFYPEVPVIALILPPGFKLPATNRRIITHTVIPELKPTLEVGLKLVPGAERVYVVNGTRPMDKWLEGMARKDFKAWEDRLEFHFLSNLPLDKIMATVSEAPEKSIVYLTSFSMDVTGRYLRNTEVSQELASYSKAPVFGLVDTMIGHGNIGGSMISFQHIGTKAGELVLDILGGTKKIENIPATMKVPQVYIFDWRQLKHWGLSASRLPAESRIINKELTLWDLRYYIAGALIFIIVQSLLIVGLLIQRRRRILAEALSRQKSNELAHVTRVAAMGELTTALAHEINQPLTAVGSNAEAARRFLSQDKPDISEIREILADIIQDNQRAGNVVRKIRDLVKRGELEQKAIDFNKAIQELILFIHSESILKGLVISTELYPGLKKIKGDRTQLQQVVLNLVLNSAAAMAHMPLNKRKIMIRTAMQDSGTAKVAVMDSGPGIDDKHIEQIFEAFYTTKKEGLGMGLSISQTIIDAHGGKIQAENNPEGGATVSFTLPCPRNKR